MNVTLKNINIQVFLFYPIKKEVDLLDIIVYNVYLSSCFNLLPIYIYIYIVHAIIIWLATGKTD